jgi:hypothetical protein
MNMRLPFQSKPKSLADRAQAAAGDTVDFARSIPNRLEGGRERTLGVAGAAAGVAAGLAFWRSRSGSKPSAHEDHAQMPTPWKTAPPANGGSAAKKPAASAETKKPVTSSKDAADSAAGSRSK